MLQLLLAKKQRTAVDIWRGGGTSYGFLGPGVLMFAVVLSLLPAAFAAPCDGKVAKELRACLAATYPYTPQIEATCAAQEEGYNRWKCRQTEYAARGVQINPPILRNGTPDGAAPVPSTAPVPSSGYVTRNISIVGAIGGVRAGTDNAQWDEAGPLATAAAEALSGLLTGGVDQGVSGAIAVGAADGWYGSPDILACIRQVSGSPEQILAASSRGFSLSGDEWRDNSFNATFTTTYVDWPVNADAKFEIVLWDVDPPTIPVAVPTASRMNWELMGNAVITRADLDKALTLGVTYAVPVFDQTSNTIRSVLIRVTPGGPTFGGGFTKIEGPHKGCPYPWP